MSKRLASSFGMLKHLLFYFLVEQFFRFQISNEGIASNILAAARGRLHTTIMSTPTPFTKKKKKKTLQNHKEIL